jgi:hypothetical protein
MIGYVFRYNSGKCSGEISGNMIGYGSGEVDGNTLKYDSGKQLG